jgi:hypothetical protein
VVISHGFGHRTTIYTPAFFVFHGVLGFWDLWQILNCSWLVFPKTRVKWQNGQNAHMVGFTWFPTNLGLKHHWIKIQTKKRSKLKINESCPLKSQLECQKINEKDGIVVTEVENRVGPAAT